MTFLPEADRDYLLIKELRYDELEELVGGGNKRQGILFRDFEIGGKLYSADPSTNALSRVNRCELLVLIPRQYPTTRLDSFYTSPSLRRADGSFPDRANGKEIVFGREWQFWSRHLGEQDWRAGIDSLETYIPYIRSEFLRA